MIRQKWWQYLLKMLFWMIWSRNNFCVDCLAGPSKLLAYCFQIWNSEHKFRPLDKNINHDRHPIQVRIHFEPIYIDSFDVSCDLNSILNFNPWGIVHTYLPTINCWNNLANMGLSLTVFGKQCKASKIKNYNKYY